MIKICKKCGKEFKVFKSSKKQFCSRSCSALYIWDHNRKRTRIKRICKYCGKEFFLAGFYKNDTKRGKYCSKKCYLIAKHKKANKNICEICGKEFTSNNGYKHSDRACSSKCYNKILKGFWNNARKLTLIRDNYTCQICGIKEKELINGKPIKLEVHHLDETGSNTKSIYMNNRLSNLVSLCHKCHIHEEIKLKGNFSKGNTKESTKLRNERMMKLYNNGLSQSKISRLFGITRQRFSQIIKKYSI